MISSFSRKNDHSLFEISNCVALLLPLDGLYGTASEEDGIGVK